MPTRSRKKAEAGRSAQTPEATGRSYLIQLSNRGSRFTIEDAQSLLAPSGVVLDRGYGPINVNPAAGNFVLRGHASDEARHEAERSIPDIVFFGDPRIGPAVSQPMEQTRAAKT